MNGLGAVEAVRGLVEGLLGAGAAPPPAPASPGALAGAAGAALGRAAGELGRGARATWRVAVAGRQAAGAEEVPVSMGLEYLLEVAVLSGAMLVVTRAFQAASPPLAGLLGIKRPLVRKKFAMALREFVFYGISLYLWWACLGHHPWLRDNASLWAPRATGGRVAVVAAEFRFIYTLEPCWYTSGLVSLIVDPKKKDFWEMAVHHVATIYLLFFSSLHGHFKIGAVVYFLHNVSDPFLNGAKLLNYLDLDGPCTAAFVGYALVFAGSRLATARTTTDPGTASMALQFFTAIRAAPRIPSRTGAASRRRRFSAAARHHRASTGEATYAAVQAAAPAAAAASFWFLISPSCSWALAMVFPRKVPSTPMPPPPPSSPAWGRASVCDLCSGSLSLVCPGTIPDGRSGRWGCVLACRPP